MDTLRWWLLLIAATMFSMAGCASNPEWRDHPTQFASGDHLSFSMRNSNGGDYEITEEDLAQAQAEAWWGDLVPGPPPVDLSGRWAGTWKGLGMFDSRRGALAEARLEQRGALGVAHLRLDDTIAAGVPWAFRIEGSRGVKLFYRVSGGDAVMRQMNGGAKVNMAFTLVGDQLVGTLPNSEPPVVITLTKIEK